MRITIASKASSKAGATIGMDVPTGVAEYSETYTTDKAGLPFKAQLKITFPEDAELESLLTEARSFIANLERDKNQTSIIDKKTGEIK